MHTPCMPISRMALYHLFLVFLMCPLLTLSVPTCTQPMIELDGIEAPFSPTPILSYVFEIQRPGGGFQFCKVVCRSHGWRGPICADDLDTLTDSLFTYSCPLLYLPPGLDIWQGHSPLTPLSRGMEYPVETQLVARCKDRTDAMEGSHIMTCVDGEWDHPLPWCSKTSDKLDFDESRPPQLQFEVSGGSWLVGRQGELVVQPGASVELDCIYNKKRGTPKWTWSNASKEYPNGWATDDKKKSWNYRLDLSSAMIEDSGLFTCTTQRGYLNSIQVSVTNKICPKLDLKENVTPSTKDTFIGTEVFFSCPSGYTRIGKDSILCRDDATWSSAGPSCNPIQCRALEIRSSHLRVLSLNNSYLGSATFDCPFGYRLTGKEMITCTKTGAWSGLVPGCEAIICPSPPPPPHGALVPSSDHYVGTTVQSICNAGYVLVGEPVTRCTQEGIWSHATPQCRRACRYPGAPLRGVITPVKFVYSVGDQITVVCDQGFFVAGTPSVHCSEDGSWSDNVPTCTDYLE